jgi:hypothetical protein
VFTRGPENLDQFYFHVPRKSGEVGKFMLTKIWGCGVYTGPENLDQFYFHVPRRSGSVVITGGPENLDQLYFQVTRKSG